MELSDYVNSDSLADDDSNNPMRDWYIRQAAYLSRMKVLAVKTVKAKIRYSAYSSDVGEAARPVAPRWVVNAAYGIVGLYIVGDVSYEVYDEKTKNNLGEREERKER